jgi:hypothetical protein
MAIKKVTELDAIVGVATDDILYIIDTDDTTDGPDGTSKKVDVSQLQGSLTGVASLNTLTGNVSIASSANVDPSLVGGNIVLYARTLMFKAEWQNTTPPYFNLTNNAWNTIPFNVFLKTWKSAPLNGITNTQPTYDQATYAFTFHYTGVYRIHFRYYTYDTNNINIQARMQNPVIGGTTWGIFFDAATHNAGADSLRMYEGTIVRRFVDTAQFVVEVYPDANQPYPSDLNNQRPEIHIELLGSQVP